MSTHAARTARALASSRVPFPMPDACSPAAVGACYSLTHSLPCSAAAGVFAVLICFVGYLVQRGYRMGIVEAIATTIFIGFACDYCVHIAQVHSAQRGGGGGGRGAERLTRTLEHAGPSLYGAALTTVGAALPLLFCFVVVFRQMGEFISVCTCFSFAVALTLIAPATCVAADFASGCCRPPGSANGRGSDTCVRNAPREPRCPTSPVSRCPSPPPTATTL